MTVTADSPISIHAPREGGDGYQLVQPGIYRHFNPRPPRGGRLQQDAGKRFTNDFNPRPPRGGRRCCASLRRSTTRFQSTPPARGATAMEIQMLTNIIDFNPRPPRGGRRDAARQRRVLLQYFNPRPPRGGRLGHVRNSLVGLLFQSTPPARGATPVRVATPAPSKISIHAPREGGDSKDAQFYLRIFDK